MAVTSSRKKIKDRRRKLQKEHDPASETLGRPGETERDEALNGLSRWLTTGPHHPLAGQFCPSPAGSVIISGLFYACRNAPEYFWQIAIPPLAYTATSIMCLCFPHPAKPIVAIFVWNHGFRAFWWLWVGPMPFVNFCLGMSWPLIPCFGKRPHFWSPTGGMVIGYITFKFGVRVAYECHTPTRDCDHSGGALNKDDALCEIEQDVLFLDIGSDGQVWFERVLLLLLVAMLFLATTRYVFGVEQQ